jgi:hypothetical protein
MRQTNGYILSSPAIFLGRNYACATKSIVSSHYLKLYCAAVACAHNTRAVARIGIKVIL